MRVPALAAASLLLLAACSSSGPSHSAPSTSAPAGAPTSTTPASSPTTGSGSDASRPIGHVFVVNLENEDYETTWGAGSPARYLNGTLVPMGKLLTNYYAVGHVSLDNYIAQISGQSPNPETQADCVRYLDFAATGTGAYGQALGRGCVYPSSVKTIADQLTAAGKSWRAYMESMKTSCRHPTLGGNDPTIVAKPDDMYATRHDPFVYFHSIVDDAATCATHVVDFSHLATDLQSVATTPNLTYVTPDVCDDGHDTPCKDGRPGGLVSADAFLAELVPKILASPAYRADGLLVISVDEAETANATACCHTPPAPNAPKPGIAGPGGGRVGTLVLSPKVAPGTTDPTPYNHYSLLCSIEDVFGLAHLGFAGAPGLACFGKDVYDRAP